MRRLVVVIVSAVLAVSCGVPLDDEPVPVDVEYQAPVAAETTEAGSLVAISMFLIREERLVPVTRDLSDPVVPAEVAQSLLEGPTVPEERSRLRTAIPGGTRLLGIAVEGSTALVDLNREFTTVGGEEEILAIAQIVLTLTALDGVERVGFLLEGVATNVPLPDGALSEMPVTADPYLELVALGGDG